MSAHTPGKWKVQPGEINIGPHNKGLMVGPLQYAKVHVIGPFEGALDEETRANARLIAAAPDLLEACRMFKYAQGLPALSAAYRAALDAIAKATSDESECPGHIASDADPKVCGRCGTHIDSLRPEGGAA